MQSFNIGEEYKNKIKLLNLLTEYEDIFSDKD